MYFRVSAVISPSSLLPAYKMKRTIGLKGVQITRKFALCCVVGAALLAPITVQEPFDQCYAPDS